MSDLPDYQRNIQVVAGDIDVAEYDASPEDISDGERGPLLIDIKGRLYTLADIRRIAGVDVVPTTPGELPVTSNIVFFKGLGFKDPTASESLPVSLEGGAGWDACHDAWKVILTEPVPTINVDVVDGATRLLGIIYGSQGQKVQQKALTYELLTYDSYVAGLLAGGLPSVLDTDALKIKEQSPLSALKIWDGTNYLATPGVGDAIARGVFILGSDYATPTPTAKIVKVDSSGRLSCVLG